MSHPATAAISNAAKRILAAPKRPLTAEQKTMLDKIIRVDQAGELGANLIYSGQHTIYKLKKSPDTPLIKHMWDQEILHHNAFNDIQVKNRVRPSILTPLWRIGAYGMGAATAMISPQAAMACTEAVETVIGGHYNSQLRWLLTNFPDEIEKDQELGFFKHMIKQFRDDELEHLDTAIQHDAHGARPYLLLTETIKACCKTAIWAAERV